MAHGQFQSAVYFAKRALLHSQGSLQDYQLLAHALLASLEFARAKAICQQGLDLFPQDLELKVLLARCLAHLEEWDLVLELFDEDDQILLGTLTNLARDQTFDAQLLSWIGVLRARAYEAMENRVRAMKWYLAAFSLDPFCIEAFEKALGVSSVESIGGFW
jgi:anaphase-promoting complex subunit 6